MQIRGFNTEVVVQYLKYISCSACMCLKIALKRWRILYFLGTGSLTSDHTNDKSDYHRFMKHLEKAGWGEEEGKQKQAGKVKPHCL